MSKENEQLHFYNYIKTKLDITRDEIDSDPNYRFALIRIDRLLCAASQILKDEIYRLEYSVKAAPTIK